ncbi:Aste57867_4454 [Aphanomyces stellatus]|uniref:Aste57867_4454 protein n=1 Tax=Aphanomyces stellatus TaxID=120398 RepID=A0A485KFF7_9STRA|nr:hypothetical protein As57867_004442 [Aphanomyces stellatus]VFT81565.1 Aste57867_4454 [Aphanomyces stellatus]
METSSMATASDESTDLAQVQTLSLFQGGETNTSIENAAAHATQTVGQAHVNLELAQTMDLSEANPRHNFVDKSNCDVVSSLEPKKDVRPQYRRPAPVESKAPPLHPLEAPRTTALSAADWCINTPNALQCSAPARRIKWSHCANPPRTALWTLYDHS